MRSFALTFACTLPLSLFPYTTLFRSILPMTLAVAGAIASTSGHWASSICSTLCCAGGAHSRVATGSRVSVSKVSGVMNCCAPSVITTDRKSTRLNSSHEWSSYAVFCFNIRLHATSVTLSLHDALPIYLADDIGRRGRDRQHVRPLGQLDMLDVVLRRGRPQPRRHRLAGQRLKGERRDELLRSLSHHHRSEEHTSELQSRVELVCGLLL